MSGSHERRSPSTSNGHSLARPGRSDLNLKPPPHMKPGSAQ